jgi:hypothetical protein
MDMTQRGSYINYESNFSLTMNHEGTTGDDHVAIIM